VKIALVSPYDYAYPGGVVNHITALEKQLSAMGHDVRVIAPASKPINSLGERFIRIGTPRPIPVSGTTARICISLRLANRIKEVLAAEKFDIVHLHEPFLVMLCSAMLRFSNGVNIGTFHAIDSKPGYKFGWPISRVMLKRRIKKLSGKIAVSRPAMEFSSKYIPGPYEIIPNGIDLEHFKPDVEPVEQYMDGRLNILFVGRLEKRKGLKYLITAYRHVKKQIPESRLIVVGPGTRMRKGYERQVKEAGLKDDVIFVGSVSSDDLPRYYKTADIFCAPATGQESFGIVLLEAMAVGTPIVASRIDGYASVLTHGREGLLVPPKDSGELARALLRMAKDESLRQEMGNRGMLTARNYSWQRVAQTVVAYYNDVLSRCQAQGSLTEYEVSPASL
jgi:phosphatidylinositol alpha-mannosyltransferase